MKADSLIQPQAEAGEDETIGLYDHFSLSQDKNEKDWEVYRRNPGLGKTRLKRHELHLV